MRPGDDPTIGFHDERIIPPSPPPHVERYCRSAGRDRPAKLRLRSVGACQRGGGEIACRRSGPAGHAFGYTAAPDLAAYSTGPRRCGSGSMTPSRPRARSGGLCAARTQRLPAGPRSRARVPAGADRADERRDQAAPRGPPRLTPVAVSRSRGRSWTTSCPRQNYEPGRAADRTEEPVARPRPGSAGPRGSRSSPDRARGKVAAR